MPAISPVRFNVQLGGLVVVAGLLLGGCSGKDAGKPGAQAAAHDFMVVANRPNNVHLIDLKEQRIVRTCELPGKYGSGTLQLSPDHKTAYVVSNQFERVYGVSLEDCSIRFSASGSAGDVRVKTMGGIALSPDGTELYMHQIPGHLLPDHYEAMDTRVAVYRTADGLDAKPVRSFPAPRQVTFAATGRDGTLYLAGQDIFAMDVKTGEYNVKLASLHSTDAKYGQRDVLSVWPIGTVSNEMIRMYSAPRFTDATQNLETAEWVWGYERVDLVTGEAESRDFGPLEEVLFSGMTRPGDRNQFYAVLTRLKKYDVAKQTAVLSVDLEHSYYCINFSSDGKRVYLGGTFNDIAIYDADTLEKLGNIELPGGDMALATVQVFAANP